MKKKKNLIVILIIILIIAIISGIVYFNIKKNEESDASDKDNIQIAESRYMQLQKEELTKDNAIEFLKASAEEFKNDEQDYTNMDFTYVDEDDNFYNFEYVEDEKTIYYAYVSKEYKTTSFRKATIYTTGKIPFSLVGSGNMV